MAPFGVVHAYSSACLLGRNQQGTELACCCWRIGSTAADGWQVGCSVCPALLQPRPWDHAFHICSSRPPRFSGGLLSRWPNQSLVPLAIIAGHGILSRLW